MSVRLKLLYGRLSGHLSLRSRHLQNAGSFVVSRIVALGLYLVPVPFFIAHQGEQVYGVLTLLLLVFSYLHMFDLGVGYAVSLRVTRALSRGNRRASVVIGAAIPLFAVCSAIVTVGLILLAVPMSRLLFETDLYTYHLRLLAVSVGFLMVSSLLTSVLQAYNRVDWINYSRLALDVAKAAALTAGALSSDGLLTAVSIVLAGSIVKCCVDFWLAWRLLSDEGRISPRLRYRDMGVNMRLGMPMVATTLLGIVITSADRIYVSRVFGQEALAYYSVAADICSKAYFLVWAVTSSIYTLYVRRSAARSRPDDLTMVSLAAVAAVFFLFYLPLGLFAEPVVSWFISPAFAQHAAPVVRIWTMVALAYLITCVYHNYLQAYGRPMLLFTGSVMAVTVLLIGMATVPSQFGLEGIAFIVFLALLVHAVFLFTMSRVVRKAELARGTQAKPAHAM